MKIKGKVIRVNKKNIVGWCFSADSEKPQKVNLLLDDQIINTTYAIQKHSGGKYDGQPVRFRFGMESVWKHLRPDQALSVRSELTDLKYKGEVNLPLRLEDEESAEPLLPLLEQGYLINKKGKLQKPREENAAWFNKTYRKYASITDFLKSEFNLDCFALYGVCLGYARAGRMMSYDLDLDLGYLSAAKNPQDVQKEFEAVSRAFVLHDQAANPMIYKLQFPGHGISLTPAWFDTNGTFHTTFGYVGAGARLERSDVAPVSMHDWLNGEKIALPARPDKVARYLYGPNWKYPDTGWSWLPEYRNYPDIAQARLTEKIVSELSKTRSVKWERDTVEW